MNCALVESLLGAALDGELDSGQQFQLQEHLEGCPSCKGAYGELENLQARVRTEVPYQRIPDALAAKLGASIRAVKEQPVQRAEWPWKWMALAASVLLVLSLGWNVVSGRRALPEDRVIAAEVFSGHVRAMLGNHQVDVISSDRHTVKPWFGDKLDFSPDVKDLASAGFPLIGGRVDYINGRAVAALVFQRSKHVINLFTWPATHSLQGGESRNGYHLLAWTRDGMSYWVVSDLNVAELTAFTQLYQGSQ